MRSQGICGLSSQLSLLAQASPSPFLLGPLKPTLPDPQAPGTFCFRSFFCSPVRAAMLSRAQATSGGSRMSGWSSPVSESFSLSSLV